MAERSSLNQVVQVGVESTAGTSVAASKLFQSIGIEPTPNIEIDQFRPSGQKYRSLATLNREWATAAITGKPTYTELIYLLSSVVNTGVITTPGGATNARNWQFISSSTADDTPKTLTVEHGSAVRADKFTYGLITEVGMSFSRTGVDLTGSMIGRRLTDGITLTAAPTALDLVPVLPSHLSVYLDTTAAGLGTTKLGRALSLEFNLGSRFAPVWNLDRSEASFVAHIESEPDLSLSMTLQADAEGMGLLDDVRNGDTVFARVEAVGAEIESGQNYSMTIDIAGQISDTGGFSDEDGVYAIEWSLVGITDPVWGQAFEINVVNDITAL